MLPTFFGLNSVTRALMAQQEAVDVVNQNISNASTPGYSRQEAILSASDPYTVTAFDRPSLPGQLGTGAEVTKINRYGDELLNAQLRTQTQGVGQLSTMDDLFTQIQSIFNDPSAQSLDTATTTFFNAVHDLSNDPQSSSARQIVEQDGVSLSGAISSRYQQLTGLQLDLNTKVQSTVADINSTITQIASLNTQIAEVQGVGSNANDLMDRRDQLVDHLSSLVDTRDVKNADGTDTIQMNGRFLVNKDQAYTLTALTDASSTAAVKPVNVFWQADVTKFRNENPGYDPVTGNNVTTGLPLVPAQSVPKALITNGALGGIIQTRDKVIQGTLLPELNELADSLTNTQALGSVTGLTAGKTLSGSDSFTITVLTPAGKTLTFDPSTSAPAPTTVQNVIDAINTSAVSPYVHASLNASGQMQIDTIAAGALVKVDQADPNAAKDFGFVANVADGFNMVHVQGYGLNTPAQVTGGISGLTLATPINIGVPPGVNDGLTIQAPDGTTLNVVVPSPLAPATQNTIQDLLTAINSAGLSHGVQAALDSRGHLIVYAAPTVFGPSGQVLGTPAQLVGANSTPVMNTTALAGGGSLTIQGPKATATFTTVAGETVTQLMQAINAAGLGVTASVNSIGQFQVTSSDSGASQSITVTASGADMTGTLGLPAGPTTVTGLSRGFEPSSSVSITAAQGNSVTEFLGSFPPPAPAPAPGQPPIFVNTVNTNQFFFQGASQVLPGATQADTAGSISVDANIVRDQSLIAASSAPSSPGNSDNALALLNVQQNATIATTFGGSTIGDFYSTTIANLGAAAQQTHTGRLSQEQLVQHIQNQKQSIVGVSLDEEAAHLVALQNAYQAAARAISVQDSMLNTIINGMGLVGLGGSGG